ncbi:MAG: hypothetical protein AAB567_02330 [Patescibacteria group bacterium]
MRYFLLAISLVLGGAVIFTFPVHALTISPVKMEISGDPGQTLLGEIELFNEQDEIKTFYSSSQNFEARGESGAPHFLPDTNEGLASWIEIQENVTLKAQGLKKIPFSIQIPESAQAGGYFAAILWGSSPAPQQEGGQVAIGGKLGMLILLSVHGESKEGGGLLDFKIDEGGRVVNSLPITFTYRFSNKGTERIKPTGELKVKNLFGFTVVTLDANRPDGNVLPGSVRKFQMVWAEKNQEKSDVVSVEKEEDGGFFSAVGNQWSNFALGPYNAKLSIAYGKDNKTAEASYRFFVIPWQLLSIVIFILALLGFGGWFGLKKYNHWIISKASSRFQVPLAKDTARAAKEGSAPRRQRKIKKR